MSEELCRTSCLTSVLTKATHALGVPFLLQCHFGNVCALHLGGSPLFPLFPSLPLTICYPRPCLRDSRSFSYHFSNKSFQTHPDAQPKPGESVNNEGASLGKAVQVRDSSEERSAALPPHGWEITAKEDHTSHSRSCLAQPTRSDARWAPGTRARSKLRMVSIPKSL